jgi:hypothetical protein
MVPRHGEVDGPRSSRERPARHRSGEVPTLGVQPWCTLNVHRAALTSLSRIDLHRTGTPPEATLESSTASTVWPETRTSVASALLLALHSPESGSYRIASIFDYPYEVTGRRGNGVEAGRLW